MKLQITPAQIAFLRSKAHSLTPVAWVGQNGVTPALVAAIDQALLDHELIKVRLRRPENKKASAQELAAATSSASCGLVGHTVILYRKHPEKPVIKLP
jgi:RNA-binding protein